MYFWKIEALKRDLIEKPMTDREVLPYFIIFLATTSLLPLLPSEEKNTWDVVGDLGGVFFAVFGTIYLFRVNGGVNGTQFVQHYLAIGFVVMLRLLPFLALSVLGFYALHEWVIGFQEETQWYDALFIIAVGEVVYFWRLAHHLGEVAAKCPHSSSPTVINHGL